MSVHLDPLTREWIDKAEGDFHTAIREGRARKYPNYDAICFHCQQCAEKYLKAYLQEQGQYFPPRHDLVPLLDLCITFDPTLDSLRNLLKDLNKYAVDFRYPGESAVKEDARDALEGDEARAFIHAQENWTALERVVTFVSLRALRSHNLRKVWKSLRQRCPQHPQPVAAHDLLDVLRLEAALQ